MPDAQAAHESTLTGILPALAGIGCVYGAGMLELGMSLSMEQLLIDSDIITMIKQATKGITVSEETLALSTIKEVGAGNNFLAHKNTRENIDYPAYPMLFDRHMYGDWEAAGSKDIVAVAHEKVTEILSSHQAEPIDRDILKDMRAIVDECDKKFK